MDREDDTNISGQVVLFRRIPPDPDNVQWLDDGPVPSTSNFRDKENELSVAIAAETTADEQLEGHEGFGLIQITAQEIRDACPGIKLCRCVEEPAKGHVLAVGKVTRGMANKLKVAAKWVGGRLPARDPPEPSSAPPQ
jgi:hypothetical protein